MIQRYYIKAQMHPHNMAAPVTQPLLWHRRRKNRRRRRGFLPCADVRAAPSQSGTGSAVEYRRSAVANLLTPVQEILLAKRIEKGDRTARELLVRANLRLVGAVAQRYQGQGVPLEDLMQEGNIGLLQAADKFNWRKGFRFSTYAVPWIRKAISRAIANSGRTIRLPVHVVEAIGRLTRVRGELENKLGYRPTREELAQAAGMTEKQVIGLLQNMAETVSLDQPIGEGEETFAEFLPAGESQSPSARIFRHAIQEEIARALKTLTPREQEVLRLRYGLHGFEPYTLDEIGRVLHISRERARQLETQALEKLRGSRAGQRLKESLMPA